MIVTFYSFKGGVGRSMALVNVAEILADRGYRVIACDWDLEAPGLERYFTSRELQDAPWKSTFEQLIAAPGLVDLISAYRDSLSSAMEGPSSPGPEYETLGNILVRRPSSVAVPVSTDLPTTRHGWVRLLSAGRRDGVFQHSYAELVRSFNWEEFYNRWAGGSYIEFLRRDLVNTPDSTGAADILLVDSRTGVTEQGGICTHHLADLVILMSAANDANLAGIQWMAEALTDKRLTTLRNDRPVEVIPVAARIEQFSEKEETVDFRNRFVAMFGRYTQLASGVTLKPRAFEIATELPYAAFYSFTERVVAREPEDRRNEVFYNQYVNLADAIIGNGVARNLLRDIGGTRDAIEVAGRARAQKRRYTVYVSMASRDSEKGKIVVDGLRHAGLDAVTRGEWQGESWRRVDRVLILREEEESDAQSAEIAAAVRQSMLRNDVGIVTLDADDVPSGSASLAFFEALADEIASSDTSLIADEQRIVHPGEQPLTEEHAAIFFGRDAELAHVASQWPGTSRWLDVGGDSGFGKTSFVRAGVIPMIRRGEIRGIDDDAEVTIVRAADDIRTRIDFAFPPGKPRVVVIEDCDRLASLGFDELHALWHDLAGVFLITTWRTENPLAARASSPPVTITLSALRVAEARQVLVASTALVRITWEDGLLDRIICDLTDPGGGSEDAATPVVDPSLLAIVLGELLDSGTPRVTHKKYDDGGCAGNRLTRLAAAAVERTGDLSRAQALLGRLVTPAGDPKPIAAPAAVETLGGGDEAKDFLDRIAELRVIRVGSEVQLRHPMIGRWWPSLRRAAERDHASRALEAARALWTAINHDESALPHGGALRYMASARVADDESRTFIRVAKRKQWERRAMYTVTAFAFLFSGVFLRYWWEERQQSQATRDAADGFAQRSLSETADPVRALVLAIAAGEKAETPLVRQALEKGIRNSRLRAVLKHDGTVIGADFSSDDPCLMTVTSNGGVEKWDLRTGKSVGRQQLDIPGAFDIDASSSTAAVATDVGTAITNLTSSAAFPGLPGVTSITVNPTRDEVALASPSTVVTGSKNKPSVFDVVDGNIRNLHRIIYKPDGESLIGIAGRTLNVWTRLRSERYNPIRDYVIAHQGGVESFAISRGGDRVVTTGTTDNGARMWRIDPSLPDGLASAPWGLTGRTPLFAPRGAFGNNDNHVLLLGDDGIHVWPVASPSGGILIKPPIGTITTADFDRRRPRIVARGTSGQIALIDLNANATTVTAMRIVQGSAGVLPVAFSVDGSQIVSGSAEGSARLWWTDDPGIPKDFEALLEAARRRLPITLTEADQAALRQ